MQLTELKDTATSILAEACHSRRVDAASLAFMHRGEILQLAQGFANRPEGVEATAETLFHIGSVTKSLTAELVWKLVHAGRLDPGLPVIDAAPELSHLPALSDRSLTISHLLSHTGGIDGDVIFDAGRGKDVLRRYMSQIRELDSLYAPGAHFSYANLGYGILGRIVELASGAAFEDLLAKSLRGDHGLSQVAILPIEKIRRRTALYFETDATGTNPSYFWPHSNIASGTVLAMSMPDLARWGSSHFADGAGRVPALTDAMRKPVIALPHNHRYEGWGCGFSLLDDLGDVLLGHDGGTAGTSTYFRVAPRHRTSWAFAATGPGGGATYQQLEPLLREMAGLSQAPVRVPPGGPAPDNLSRYAGTYRRYGVSFAVKDNPDGTLRLAVEGPMAPGVLDAVIMRPLSTTVCEARIPVLDRSVWISFHDFDDSGKPELLFVTERMARRSNG